MSVKPPKISIAGPSRGRPELLERLVVSGLDLAAEPDAIEASIYVDADDPKFEDYKRLAVRMPMIRLCGGPSLRPIHSHNIAVSLCQADWVGTLGDDVVMRSQDWDLHVQNVGELFTDRMVVMYPRDSNPEIQAHFFCHRRLPEVLGYMMFPGFVHYNGDTWLQQVMSGAGRSVVLDNVMVEHLHYRLEKAPFDETYQRSHNAHIGSHDQTTMARLQRLIPAETEVIKAEIARFAQANPEAAARIPVQGS